MRYIANIDDIPWTTTAEHPGFGARRKRLAAAAGGARLGCSLYELERDRPAWPRHLHFGNEEAYFVLDGQGELCIGDERFPVEAGQWVALVANTGRAHQLRNASDTPLRYLCLSTMDAPDIAYYPDSKKLGVFGGAAPGGDKSARTLDAYLLADGAVAYWTGEVPGAGGPVPAPAIVAGPTPEIWPPIAGPQDALVRDVQHGRVSIHGESLGAAAGSVRLGCTRFVCGAGGYSFPRHAHTANEEAIFVLRGTGTSIRGDEATAIRPGDYIVYPPGLDHAHHVRADAASELEYLAFSTNDRPEVVFYPDSAKVGLLAMGRTLILDESATLGYFDREPEE